MNSRQRWIGGVVAIEKIVRMLTDVSLGRLLLGLVLLQGGVEHGGRCSESGRGQSGYSEDSRSVRHVAGTASIGRWAAVMVMDWEVGGGGGTKAGRGQRWRQASLSSTLATVVSRMLETNAYTV